MTAREYWIMTEVFVYLHGSDACADPGCKHCAFIHDTWSECDEGRYCEDPENMNLSRRMFQ